jgi:hypothetical protein
MGGSEAHPGASARFGLGGATDPFEAVAAADGFIGGLDGGHGPEVGEVDDAEQAAFAVGDFETGFGGDDGGACPGRKGEDGGTYWPLDNGLATRS